LVGQCLRGHGSRGGAHHARSAHPGSCRPHPSVDPLDRRSLTLSALALASLFYTIIEAPDNGWSSGRTLAGFAIAAVAFVTLVIVEHRPRHRVDPRRRPSEQAGVGSAVNDATRLVGGTLGVAILGSVCASLYRAQPRLP
jgi:hypothetical protein